MYSFVWFSVLSFLRVVHTIFIVVLISDSHISFVDLTSNTLSTFVFYFAINQDEIFFYIFFLNLSFHFLGTQIPLWEASIFSVFISILLEVNETILHDMKCLSFLHVLSTISFCLFNVLSSFEEMVLNPVLAAIQNEGIDHHNKEKFHVCMTLENW